jgi:catechol 2,3-dioxygenase
LEEHADAPARPRGSPGLFHLAFLFPDRASLATAVLRLVAENWPLLGASDHGVSEAIYLDDPEGNGLELYADRSPAEWPRAGGDVNMGTLPLALGELRALGQRAPGDYSLPPETRLGHIHLNVADLAQAEQTFAGRLGMAVRQRNYSGALFLGYDRYHHHIAVNTWGVRHPAQRGCLGLASFTMQLGAELRVEASALEMDGVSIEVQPQRGAESLPG